jgi:hypothetical protein
MKVPKLKGKLEMLLMFCLVTLIDLSVSLSLSLCLSLSLYSKKLPDVTRQKGEYEKENLKLHLCNGVFEAYSASYLTTKQHLLNGKFPVYLTLLIVLSNLTFLFTLFFLFLFL